MSQKRSFLQNLKSTFSKYENDISDDLTAERPSMSRIVFTCLAIALGGVIYGYDTGAISGMLNMPKYIEAVGVYDVSTDSYNIPSWRSGLIVSGVSIGGLAGSLALGKIAETYGRKWAVAVAAGFINISTLIQAVANSSWQAVFIGRVLSGISIGGLSVVCPMYLSETAPTSMRALLVSAFQFLITVGILCGQIVSYGCSHWHDSKGQYLVTLLIICFFAIILFVTAIVYLPESARYYLSKNKVDDAKKSMGKVMNLSPSSGIVQHEIWDIQASVDVTRQSGKATWSELLSNDSKVLYRIIVGTCIMMLQQLTGINYFFYYGTSLFGEISDMNPFGTTVILGAVNVVGTIIFLPIIYKYPRRKVLMSGSLVMFIAFILFACLGSFDLKNSEGVVDTKVGTGMIVLACLFIVGFAGTWAPISFLVISEMYPQRIRSKAISLATSANWLVNTGITFLTPVATKSIDYKYGFVFSFFTFISIFFVYFFVYETRGLSLEAIEEMFESGISARRSYRWNPIMNEREEQKETLESTDSQQGAC